MPHKIVLVLSSMHGGGTERVASLLCNHWVRAGHQVFLVPTFANSTSIAYPLDPRIQVQFLGTSSRLRPRTVFSQVMRLLRLRRLLRMIAPTRVISFLTNVNVATLIAAQGLSLPVVVSERTYPPLVPTSPLLRALRRLTYPFATAVVMQTRDGETWLQAECPRAKAVVIPNPLEFPIPSFEPVLAPDTLLEPQHRLVLAVGRLSSEKQYPILLHAWREIREDYIDCRLVILGEGSERASLVNLAKELHIEDTVIFAGRVGNLGDWYARADLYVLCSQYEGFPNSLLEALAHGTPAIAFDCKTGPQDLIPYAPNSMLVPPDAGCAGLAAHLRAALSEGKIEKADGASVRDAFAIEKIAARWLDLPISA